MDRGDETDGEADRGGLGAFLRAHHEAILQRWSTLVLGRVAAARDLPKPLLRDHLPDLLSALSESLDRRAPGSASLTELPLIHALERLDEGFDLAAVVTEYRLLRRAILEELEESRWNVALPQLIALGEVIDKAIAASVERYTAARGRTLRAMDRISEVALANPGASPDELLSRLLTVLMETTAAVDSVAVLRLEGDALRVRAAVGPAQEGTVGTLVALGECVAGLAAQRRQPVNVRNAATDPLVSSETIRAHGTRGLYAVPLMLGETLLGVAMMGSRSTYEFSDEDLLLFRLMASRATSLTVQSELAARDRAQRAEAQTALSHSNALFEGAPAGIAFLDTEFRYLRINESLAKLNGRSVEEHLGRRVSQVLPKDEVAGVESVLQKVLETGQPVRRNLFTLDRPALSPEPIHFSADYFPVRSAGKLIGIGAVLVDVTAQHRAEESRRASEERMRAILDHSPAAIYVKDEEGRMLLANQASEKVLGHLREELLGRPDSAFMPPEAAAAIRANDLEVLRTGRARSVEEVVPGPDGDHTYLSVKFPLPRSPSSRAALGGISTDITERKQLEVELREQAQAVRESQERLQLVVKGAQIGTFELDLQSGQALLNETARMLHGLTEDRVYAREEILASVHPDDVATIKRDLEAAQLHARDGVYGNEYRTRGMGGREHWVVSRGRVLFDDQGRPIRLLGVAIDITERKHEEEFRERFLGIVSHDLRNPLSVIRVSTQVLERSEDFPDRLRRPLHRIGASAERMTRMISDLLDFTRGRLGSGIPVTPSRLNLRHLVRHVLDDLEIAHPESKLRLTATGNFEGEWDQDRLTQLVTNLVENGIRYGADGKPVEVTLEPVGEEAVRIGVRNSGPPIPPKLLPHIFDPFRRGGDQEEHAREGLGLGLFIAQLVVEAHRGKIEVHSDAQHGTEFVVTLPRRASKPTEPTAAFR